MKNTNQIAQILGFITLACCLFGAGFYFGYNNYKAKVDNGEVSGVNTSVTSSIESSSTQTQVSSIATLENKSQTQATKDVYWIKVGTEPVCPASHPIKGKFDDSSAKFFYTKDNKSYDRVRPDICFSSEDFALNQAGFVKKY